MILQANTGDMSDKLQLTNTYLIETSLYGGVDGEEKSRVATSPDKAATSEGKVKISGDDILIEYCQRLKHALKKIPDAKLRPVQQAQLIRFITHYIWQMPDKVDINAKGTVQSSHSSVIPVSFWVRIQNRIKEMKERRKKLIRIQLKSQSNQREPNTAEYTALIKRKHEVLKKFDSTKLESTLRESTKSAALELVLTLLPDTSKHGILIDLEGCFGVVVDPESPSYKKQSIGQKDLNGNMITQAESSRTIDTSEGSAQLSPEIVSSGQK